MHPWIFQRAIEKPAERLPGGSVVDVVDVTGRWIGRGLYNGHARIGVRVLTTDQSEMIDKVFFRNRILRALELRQGILGLDKTTDSYRIVHSEADGLSGLVIDRFANYLVIEFFASGMYRFFPVIKNVLTEFFPEAGIYWFAEERVQKQESMDCRSPNAPDPFVIRENGINFYASPGATHKTGFFLDQRENRKLLASHCVGKNVLDICCHSGGFAIYAKVAGDGGNVVGIDIDENAVVLAGRNASLNNAQVQFIQADLFKWLPRAQQDGRLFDVVILDPSRQSKNRDETDVTLRRYVDMNREALRVVSPGGVFLTCSCTGLIKEADFLDAVRRAAWQAKRTLQVFRVTGAGPDHPFLAHVEEGRYLKAIWCRVF